MKFVSSKQFQVNPKPVFEAAEGGDEIVLTSRGRPVALLVGISGEDLGETVGLIWRARAQAAAARMRKKAAKKVGITLEEIDEEVRAARGGLRSRGFSGDAGG